LYVDGKLANFDKPGDAIAAGICMVYQETSLVPTMTAAQNIELGNERLLTSFRTLNIQAQQLLQSLNFHIDPATPVALLGTAKRQMVEIARAVYQKACIIVFDEPTGDRRRHRLHHRRPQVERLLRDHGGG
jgi:ABC-type sugar transport system ATPase subunit